MATHGVFRILLPAAAALLASACATQNAPIESLGEKYFEQEAKNYLKFEHEGQTVYCQSHRKTGSLVPHKQCITEAGLRRRVEDARLARNPVVRGGPQHVATVPGGR